MDNVVVLGEWIEEKRNQALELVDHEIAELQKVLEMSEKQRLCYLRQNMTEERLTKLSQAIREINEQYFC